MIGQWCRLGHITGNLSLNRPTFVLSHWSHGCQLDMNWFGPLISNQNVGLSPTLKNTVLGSTCPWINVLCFSVMQRSLPVMLSFQDSVPWNVCRSKMAPTWTKFEIKFIVLRLHSTPKVFLSTILKVKDNCSLSYNWPLMLTNSNLVRSCLIIWIIKKKPIYICYYSLVLKHSFSLTLVIWLWARGFTFTAKTILKFHPLPMYLIHPSLDASCWWCSPGCVFNSDSDQFFQP